MTKRKNRLPRKELARPSFFRNASISPKERAPALHPRDLDTHFFLSTKPRMSDLRVLVTGAGTGIGRGIALRCAQEGARVVIHYYNETEGASSALNLIEKAGGTAQIIKADLSRESGLNKLISGATKFLGGVDVLVNNAGITANIPWRDITPAQYETLTAVNARAPFFLTQKIAPMMIKQGGGSIINFASCHTLKISPEHEVYMSTKAAIEAMTKSFGVQLAPYGVRVNAIRPGWCLTENHFTSEPKGTDFKKAAASLPLRYISTPYDIGDLVVALVTELHYFAGAILDYTGGHGLIAPGVDDITAPLKGRFGRAYVKGLK